MRRPWLVVSALAGAAACNPENQTQYAYAPSSARVAAMPPDTPRYTPVAAMALDSAPAPAVRGAASASLAALPPHGARADVHLESSGGATRISMRLSRGVAGRHYSGAIRLGTCERIGPQVAALTPASADTLGTGRAVSFARLPLDRLASAPHVIIYGEGAKPEMCGAVRAR